MGHDLYRMLRASILPELAPGEQAVALVLADICMDETGKPPQNMDASKRVCEDLGISRGTLGNILARLAAKGLELRVPIGKDKHGRSVYAAKGHSVDYRFPLLSPRDAKGPLSDGPLASGPVDNRPGSAPKGPSARGPMTPKVHAPARKGPLPSGPLPPGTPTTKDDPDTGLPISQPQVEGAPTAPGQDRVSDASRSSPRTAEETAAEYRRQADLLREWEREHPEAAAS